MRITRSVGKQTPARRPVPRWGPNRRGTALAFIAVSIIPMFGLVALLLDGGLLMTEQRHARAVADSAALSAAYNLYTNYSTNSGTDPSHTARDAALRNASANGYTNDGSTSVVTVNIPPTVTTNALYKNPGYAEVIVTYNQSKRFSALWGSGTMAVSTRSVARGKSSPANPAILLLDPSMKASLNVTGNGPVTVTGGSIVVDSSNSQAGVITGNGGVTAPNINFTGSYNTTGSGVFAGTIRTAVAPTADPLASLPVPSTSGMTVQSASQYKISSSGNYTLQPGVYTGGIAISAPSPGTITLNPGIYYMDAGGFSNSGSINITGSGVMIYNNTTQNSQQIKLTGNGSLTLSPPTSGTYQGITIFQLRSSAAVVNVTGNGSMNLTGTIYSAGAEVDVTGNGGTTVAGSQIIANNMKVTGNGPINVTYSGSGSPARDTRIVE